MHSMREWAVRQLADVRAPDSRDELTHPVVVFRRAALL
jgi:hypothetical protein